MAEDELLAILRNRTPPAPPVTEFIVNGDFASDTVWNKGILWVIAGGQATHNGAFGSEIGQTMAGSLTMGQNYEITIVNTGFLGSTMDVVLGGAQLVGTIDASPWVAPFTADGNYDVFSLSTTGPGAVAIQSISLVPVP
jgi:hypothetical protein